MAKKFHVIGTDEGVTKGLALQLDQQGGLTIYGNAYNPPAGVVTMPFEDVDRIEIHDEA